MLKRILKICLLSLPIVIYFIVIGGKSVCVIGKVSQGIVCSAIMKAGIIYGICATPFDENKEYCRGLIDNSLTRYSANLFFTGCWDCEKQQLFKEKGWHKYDILEMVYEERSLISINTPAKIIASCGHCIHITVKRNNFMKKIIGFILVIFCCAIVAFNGNYDASQQLQAQDSYVYVCTGKYATKYHRYKGCKGLGNCKASIVKMTKQEAEKRGKTPCSLCY